MATMKTDRKAIKYRLWDALGWRWAVMSKAATDRLVEMVLRERDDAWVAGQEVAAQRLEGFDPTAAKVIRAGIPCICPFPRFSCPACGRPDCPACAHVRA